MSTVFVHLYLFATRVQAFVDTLNLVLSLRSTNLLASQGVRMVER